MCNTYVRPVFDQGIELKDNALLKVRPELFYEWDFEKNEALGLDVYKVTKGSDKKSWWICSNCKSNYDTKLYHKAKGSNCPYCAGKKVNHTNSLSSNNPELAKEWHPSKNGTLTPHDVTCGSGQKVWWVGECGHEWDATIDSRNRGNFGCPYCSGRFTLKGFNDMWTTNPELASLLVNSKDGYRYTKSSEKRVDWRCRTCEEIVRNKKISNVNHNGLYCTNCSDKRSYPEKIIKSLLSYININFETEKIFKWSDNKRYDFYVEEINTIIETHGEQHYYQSNRGRSLLDEQENDRYKEKLARENGIEHYIIIDARESNFEFIKSNIVNSKLNSIFDFGNIDWSTVRRKSVKNLILDTCEKFKKRAASVEELTNELKLSKQTIIKYLNIGLEIGFISLDERNKLRERKGKEVIMLNTDYSYLREYKNITIASERTKIHHSSIVRCCRGTRNYAGGFKWMYKEDYEKYIEEQKQLA